MDPPRRGVVAAAAGGMGRVTVLGGVGPGGPLRRGRGGRGDTIPGTRGVAGTGGMAPGAGRGMRVERSVAAIPFADAVRARGVVARWGRVVGSGSGGGGVGSGGGGAAGGGGVGSGGVGVAGMALGPPVGFPVPLVGVGGCVACVVSWDLVRVLRCCGVLRCVWCSACGVACAVSWASRPLFTGAHARCVVLCGRCPGPLGSCSPMCLCGMLCGVFGVLGLLAPSHRCVCVVCCVVCAVSRATWLLFTGVPVWLVLCCVFGVLGLMAPVHRRAVCLFDVLCVVRGVPRHVAAVHRCA